MYVSRESMTLSSFLRLLAWFPFADFQREAIAMAPHVVEVRDRPFELVQKDMVCACYASRFRLLTTNDRNKGNRRKHLLLPASGVLRIKRSTHRILWSKSRRMLRRLFSQVNISVALSVRYLLPSLAGADTVLLFILIPQVIILTCPTDRGRSA